MSPVILSFCMLSLLVAVSKTSADEAAGDHCPLASHKMGKIGGVIDYGSRVGKEMKVAMEMAAEDFARSSCSKQLVLQIEDSSGDSARDAFFSLTLSAPVSFENNGVNASYRIAAAVELVDSNQVQALIGTMSAQDTGHLSKIDKNIKYLPIISLTSPAITPPSIAHQLPHFFQFSDHITFHIQCLAAIVGHFKWRKVTVIYESKNGFSAYSGILTLLSDTLKTVNTEIEHHSTFPPMSSLSNPGAFIEQELIDMRRRSNRVFVVVMSSLKMAVLLFSKAKRLGMMEKGYVWIVTDEIASLLNSVDSSVVDNMQGVIGFRTEFARTSKPFKRFRSRFRSKYRSEYPEEEEYCNPSIFALRAYDATWAIAQTMKNSTGKSSSKDLSKGISSRIFRGVSGVIRFKNNVLWQLPWFQIINVVGNSYREMAVWSPESGFSKTLEKRNDVNSSSSFEEWGPVYWPGGKGSVPRGWVISEKDKPFKIGIPSMGAFREFVHVSFDQANNKTCATGFSIKVFEATLKRLPYDFPYEFVPFNGPYDEMVKQVYNKELDGAVGDFSIEPGRFRYAEFSQPYIDSRLVMIVTTKSVKKITWMLKTFTKKLWLLIVAMHMFIGCLVWILERGSNTEFEGIGGMIWFSVTVIFYAHGQSLRNSLSRVVVAPWLFVILVVTACFTADLSSRMTVSRLEPSILDIDTLLKTNASAGCNANSFVGQYLTNVLHFKPENIRRFYSESDYLEAFETGYIKAAFFVEPHAKVFLGKYCNHFTQAKSTFPLGGFGYVFAKDSPLVFDMSEAILKVVESGEMRQLERILSSPNCSSDALRDNSSLDLEPFTGLFILSGSISAFGFLVAILRMGRNLQILSCIQRVLTKRRILRWASIHFSKENSTIPKTKDQVQTSTSVELELTNFAH
ncbi:hypothetical protein DKX38_020538 [Salix brachista]|uniref:Glutamate receptor n=1 Tax=Salix brachista TaxID=2182728 RepID=A0A5N5K5J8_9ROSI|nr:hypothetical protein DKX38_020538 [Salix brachista]